MKAGIFLDAILSEKYMKISLTPPRDYAMARVGERHVKHTGSTFGLDNGDEVTMPPGIDLPMPEGSNYWNDRYYLHVAKHLGDSIKYEVDVYRNDPSPYSTNLLFAYKLLEKWEGNIKIRKVSDYWEVTLSVEYLLHTTHCASSKNLPEAIANACLSYVNFAEAHLKSGDDLDDGNLPVDLV